MANGPVRVNDFRQDGVFFEMLKGSAHCETETGTRASDPNEVYEESRLCARGSAHFAAVSDSAGRPAVEAGASSGRGRQFGRSAIKVDVDVVNLYCSVRNKQNGLVNTLEKDDFDLAEDNKPQTIKYFSKETDIPLTIGLLVDVSGSQRNLIEVERRAASAFFSSVLRKKDVAFLVSFGADSESAAGYYRVAAAAAGRAESAEAEHGLRGD